MNAKYKYVVLVENSHGSNTSGKLSPEMEGDGSNPCTKSTGPGKMRYYEYLFSRVVARALVEKLKASGVDARLLVPEDTDVTLGERTRRANKIWEQTKHKCIYVSIHSNASKSGGWGSGRGWCAYTSPGKTLSDSIADSLYAAAEKELPGMRIRTDYCDGDPDQESKFWVLVKTACPAVLTENLFHDNKEDVKVLMSEEGRGKIVNLHYKGLMSWLENHNK